MTSEARVLALVPHFRCERWLDHCLSSLVGQTQPPDGIVVIDDASPEPPTDIVRRFRGVTLLRAPSNVGPYRLVQQVIEDTAFDWYMFQDSDDWSAPDRLERLLETAQRSGAELIGSDYVMLATDEGLTIPHAFPEDANAALAAAPTGHALQHPTSLVRRDLVDRLGGYASGMRFSGDDEFLRRAAYVTQVVNVPRPLYFRRCRPESLTTSAGTGHGSPARRQVLEALATRARSNAAAVRRGEAPELDPFARSAPIALDHVCGPPLQEPPRHRRAGARAAIRRARAGLRTKAPAPVRPTLVVGGSVSGADTLLWSLAQHSRISVLVDVSWLAAMGEAFTRTEEATTARHVTVSADRQLRPLDGVGRTPADARAELVAAAARLAGGTPDGAGWAALVPPDPGVVSALLRLFPDARVIHVVRDADQTAAALGRRSKAVTDPVGPAEAYGAWLDAARGGLECERLAGADRVLRVRFDELVRRPRDAVARCLEFLGVSAEPGCARALESLDVAAWWPPDGAEASPVVASGRELSAALCGPSLLVPDERSPRSPAHVATPVPAAAPAKRPKVQAGAKARSGAPSNKRPKPPGAPAHLAGPAALLRANLPPVAAVAVVTKGDSRLGDLAGVDVRHFPQTVAGDWAGYHPAGTDEIVRHLDEVRTRGVRYFLVPGFASWWLDHYTGLRASLLKRGCLVAETPEGGSLFELDRTPPARRRRRPTVSVVSWNTTHNPLGRAYVLAALLRRRYDVEIVGGRFGHFGTETWAPLRQMDIPLRSFPGGSFPDLLHHLKEFAKTITSDAVVVSKPRLPSYLLGMLAKALDGRPLLLDVDDRELTFVGATGPRSLDDLRRRGDDELTNAHGRWWTQLCESLVGSADHVTVSNGTLHALFGGTIVPHARDESVFDPLRVDRGAARARFGFGADDRVILFGGTPRRHKGVIELAQALDEIGDPRAKLCLIGAPELDALQPDLAPYADHLHVVPPRPLGRVPELLAAADAVAVLQHPESDVSRYQMPAKITDALAMQLPCLVKGVPPLEPLIAGGHLEAVGDGGVAEALRELLNDLPAARERARPNRDLFLSEYSYGAVRPRLEDAVDSLLDAPPPSPPEHAEVIEFVRERFAAASAAPRVVRADPEIRDDGPQGAGGPTSWGWGPQAKRRACPQDRVPGAVDIVMFWKQHDTGLYGRRHDMLMQSLARSPRVGQVIQFDAPVDIAKFRHAERPGLPTHTALLREQALARVDGVEAAPGLHQYSFVYADAPAAGDPFPPRDEYLLHVKERLARHRIGERPVAFWVYPKNFDFPEIARTFGPDLVVADVVDDHRTWLRPGDGNRESIVRHYRDVAAMSDLVLVNCEPMRELIAGMASSVHLVPNAAEYPDPDAGAPLDVPSELRGLEGPVIGYAGNLSSRIDVELLDRMAAARPDWNLVLVGSSHAGRPAAPLVRHTNVVFVGPRPYAEAKRFIRGFDVGIIPHVDDAMTRAMNPLKAFVYCALGVPVVSTAIGNLGELRSLISVALDHDDFIARVDAAVRRGRVPVDPETDAVLRRNSWQERTETVLMLMDAALSRGRAGR